MTERLSEVFAGKPSAGSNGPKDRAEGQANLLTGRDQAITLCLSVLLFAVYLFTYRGGFHSIDEVSMFCVTESMVKQGTFDTNQVVWTQWTTSQREAQGFFGLDGSVYSKKGLAMSLFAIPLYWLALHVPGLGMLQTTSLLNAIVTAIMGGVLYLYTRRLAYSPGASVLLGLLFGLATTSWVYARYLFSEPVAGWLLLLSVFFLLGFKQERRWPFLVGAGVAAGLAVVARANNVICVPPLALYLLATLVERRDDGRWALTRRWLALMLVFGGALVVAGGVMALYNWVRSGSMFQTGYDLTIFSPALWLGLYKLLLSPLRGLFWFAPVLLLSLVAFVGFARRHRAEAALVGSIVLLNVLLFSAWTSGEGLSWGSRFLVPVLALCVLPLAVPIEGLVGGQKGAWRPAFWILGSLSVAIQVLGVWVNPWLYMIHLRELFPAEFLENTPVLYAPRYSPVWGQVEQLLSWTAARSDLAWWQPWGVQIGVVVALGALVIVSAAGLQHLLRSADTPARSRLALVPLACLLLALGVSLFALGQYFTTDRQFGPPDNALDRIVDRLTREGQRQDGIVTIAPLHYHVPMNRYKERLPIYGFAEMAAPLPAQATTLLGRIVTEHNRLWLVTAGVRPGDPQNGVERWLSEHAYKATDEWYDDFRLCLLASEPTGAAERAGRVEAGSGARFGDTIALDSYAVAPTRQRPGGLVTLTLNWRAQAQVGASYTVFVHLIAPDGRLAAQQDGTPAGGFAPMSSWVVGELVPDRHGLLLPADLPAGRYALWAGLYDSASGMRLPVRRPDGSSADHVVLADIEVMKE